MRKLVRVARRATRTFFAETRFRSWFSGTLDFPIASIFINTRYLSQPRADSGGNCWEPVGRFPGGLSQMKRVRFDEKIRALWRRARLPAAPARPIPQKSRCASWERGVFAWRHCSPPSSSLNRDCFLRIRRLKRYGTKARSHQPFFVRVTFDRWVGAAGPFVWLIGRCHCTWDNKNSVRPNSVRAVSIDTKS